jgi:hypothetical protein
MSNVRHLKAAMRAVYKAVLATLPLVVTLGGWRLALIADAALGCNTMGKSPSPCFVGGADLQPLLSIVAWWGMVLWIPGLVVSGLLVGRVVAPALPRPWGSAPRSGRERPQ